MTVALFTHPSGLAHDTGQGHPECADRLRYVLQALEGDEFAGLVRLSCPAAPTEALLKAHSSAHVAFVLGCQPEPGRLSYIDGDTVVSAGSITAGLHAAGGAIAAVDAVMDGTVQAAFAAMRPPGHHAEANRVMGFCLFNNAAVAAYHARDRWGLRRIAVVDFDVHHGNGTQDIFYNDPELFYASSHQHPCYPATGFPHERGIAGNVVNVPLAPGSGGPAFRNAWSNLILPALAAFEPELLIISAGFDAHRADPLAQLRLEVEDFIWITRELRAVADAYCQGRIVSLLEGGYNLEALAACAAAHVKALML